MPMPCLHTQCRAVHTVNGQSHAHFVDVTLTISTNNWLRYCPVAIFIAYYEIKAIFQCTLTSLNCMINDRTQYRRRNCDITLPSLKTLATSFKAFLNTLVKTSPVYDVRVVWKQVVNRTVRLSESYTLNALHTCTTLYMYSQVLTTTASPQTQPHQQLCLVLNRKKQLNTSV